MRSFQQRGKEITARQTKQGPGAQDGKLAEQECSRHHVDDDQRRLVNGNEYRNLLQLPFGKWQQGEKNQRRCDDHPARKTALFHAHTCSVDKKFGLFSRYSLFITMIYTVLRSGYDSVCCGTQ